MNTDTSISIAVSFIDRKSELEKIMNSIERLHNVKVDRQKIFNIWRDIKKVNIHYAVRSWR